MEINWTALIIAILTPVLPVLLAILTAKLSATQDATKKLIEANTTQAQRTLIESFVKTAVFAAEQSGLTSQLQKTGQAKFEQAINSVQADLDAAGIKVDFRIVAGLIQSEVMKNFNYSKVSDTNTVAVNTLQPQAPSTSA